MLTHFFFFKNTFKTSSYIAKLSILKDVIELFVKMQLSSFFLFSFSPMKIIVISIIVIIGTYLLLYERIFYNFFYAHSDKLVPTRT